MGGLPAARIADPSAHGGLVTMGYPTVLIGGMPASRIGDLHTCPMVTVIVPHVGGPFVLGSFTVLVGAMPQSRQTDMLICVGPPDMLAMGAPTVLVGMAGAAGLVGMAKGLGLAGLAMAKRALGVGDPVVSIKLDGSPAFVNSARNALSQIFPTPSGAVWLEQMGNNKQSVTIKETSAQNGYCAADDATNSANGKGTGSRITWNPNFNTLDPGLPGTQGSPGAPVILAHEMVHALHNANGSNRDGPDDSFPGQTGTSARNEERSTVGTAGPVQQPNGTPEVNPPDYSHDLPTENSFRDDLGIPRRPAYYPSNWPGGAPW